MSFFFFTLSIKNRIICDGQYGIGMIYLVLEYLIDYVLKIAIPTFIIINIASQINLDIPFLMWTGNLDFDEIINLYLLIFDQHRSNF